jgi:LacI family transcriptional regulator
MNDQLVQTPSHFQEASLVLSCATKTMTRRQPSTLEDIAARAGVSVGTVSRVLNGRNKENRPAIAQRSEKIRKIATQLGYRPNAAARSMLRGAFRTVAFVTCGDMGKDWYPISGLNGIHAALEALEWKLMYNELPASKIDDRKLVPQLFRETSVDGLLINLLPFFSEDIVDYFEAQPLPCVWLNLKRPLRSVYPDDISGAKLAVKWLNDRGHKRIGFFSRLFWEPVHYSALDRFAGCSQALKSAGLSTKYHLELLGSYDDPNRAAYPRAEIFLKTFPDVQAVVCYEMEEAVSLLVAAERMGRRIPDDLEIVGFSERHIRAQLGLSIPTVMIPFQTAGQRAVDMLEQMIKTGRRDIPSVAVPFDAVSV